MTLIYIYKRFNGVVTRLSIWLEEPALGTKEANNG